MGTVAFLIATTVLQLALPVALGAFFLFARYRTLVDILLRAAAFSLLCLMLSVAGYWLSISRWAGLCLPFAASAVCAFRLYVSRKLPWFRNYGNAHLFRLFRIVGVIFVLSVLLSRFFIASIPGRNAVRLELPFEEGNYVVTDGGNGFISSFANYHFSALSLNDPDIHPALKFASDIERVGASGRSVRGIPGPWLNEYLTWNASIVSPCDGTVIEANDADDENIPILDTRNFGMGNFVVIRMDSGHCVFLLHLKRGSLLVRKNRRVKVGEPLARVGNSGKSRWPHLHIHVILPLDGDDYWWGDAVPFTFGTAWVQKNQMYRAGIKP